MKKILFLIIILSGVMLQADDANRRVESDGHFSYCPPSGWNVRDFSGLKYKVVIGPAESSFAANIVFTDEAYDGNLKDYLDASVVNLKNFLSDVTVLKNEKFTTSKNLAGAILVINAKNNNRMIHSCAVCFQNGGRVVTSTLSSLVSSNGKYDKLFEDSMKTFEFTK
jgi:hypothetical protein